VLNSPPTRCSDCNLIISPIRGHRCWLPKLREAIGLPLSDRQHQFLSWLSGWGPDVCEPFLSIVHDLRDPQPSDDPTQVLGDCAAKRIVGTIALIADDDDANEVLARQCVELEASPDELTAALLCWFADHCEAKTLKGTRTWLRNFCPERRTPKILQSEEG